MRDRDHPLGLPSLSPHRQQQVKQANRVIARTFAILTAGFQAGSEFIIENPPDRSKENSPLYLHRRHCPLWHLPDVIQFRKATGSEMISFPQCAFGADYQKFTSLLISPGLAPSLRPLSSLTCTHAQHRAIAGGDRRHGQFTSYRSAAYPADLNFLFAKVLATAKAADASDRVAKPVPPPSSTAPSRPPAAPDATAVEVAEPDTDTATPPLTETATPPPSADAPDVDLPPSPSPAAPSPAPDRRPKAKPKPFTWHRGSDYPLRHRTAQGLILRPCLASTGSLSLRSRVGCAFKAGSATDSSPGNRRQAMAEDRPGWTAAEVKEINNHVGNSSWTHVDRSEAGSRRIVRFTWAYKRKRDGRLKARLCVQGCSQQPGVDYYD